MKTDEVEIKTEEFIFPKEETLQFQDEDFPEMPIKSDEIERVEERTDEINEFQPCGNNNHQTTGGIVDARVKRKIIVHPSGSICKCIESDSTLSNEVGEHEKFKCTKPEKSYWEKKYFSLHDELSPGIFSLFQCKECSCSFSRRDHLEDHIKEIHKMKPFKCDYCEYSCTKLRSLKKHVQASHLKEKPFKCNECGFFYRTKSSLAKHIQAIHNKEKPYKCNECGYSFSVKISLKRHVMAIHNKEKPYKCNECGYSFSVKISLKRHVMAIHEKEKPFKCNECGCSFSVKISLKRHVMAIHKKEKPFKCNECGYSCSQKSHLKVHVQAIHLKQVI